jgi:hypothetical protein
MKPTPRILRASPLTASGGAILVLSVAGALLCGPAIVQAEEPAPTPVPVPLVLAKEKSRQSIVGGELKLVIRKLEELVEDLESNKQFKQIQGDRMVRIKTILQKVTDVDVPSAIKYLVLAQQELASLRSHLGDADKEIRVILVELEKILGRALLNELREIIRDQEQTRDQTKEWGKQDKPDERTQKDLSEKQGRLGQRIEEFKQKEEKAAKQETDPAQKQKMENAAKALEDKQVKQNVDSAVKNIQEKNSSEAVQDQNKILDALREAEKALKADDNNSSNENQQDYQAQNTPDDASKLEGLAQDIKNLANDIDQSAPQDFKDQKADFQQREADLQNQLSDAADKTKGEKPEQGMEEAKKAMERAKDHLADDQQAPTVHALNEAVEALTPHIAMMRRPVPVPPPPFNPDPKEGPRLHKDSTKVAGQKPTADGRWSPLSQQQREALYENYVNQLPPEYRKLLRDYYEALSK